MVNKFWLDVVDDLNIFFSLKVPDNRKDQLADYLEGCFQEAVEGAELIHKSEAYDYVCDNLPYRYF